MLLLWNKMITISVIIPAYNAENTLSRALQSVKEQIFQPLEIIVIDDGSTDQTASIVESFPGVKLIRQKNSGPSVARNTGIFSANASYIAFLDADDAWQENHLQEINNTYTLYPDLEWYSCSYKIIKDGVITHKKNLRQDTPIKIDYFFHYSKFGYFINTNTIAIKTIIAKELGGFNANWQQGEDWTLFTRIAIRHPFIGFNPAVTSSYIITPNSQSKKKTKADLWGYFERIRFIEAELNQFIKNPNTYQKSFISSHYKGLAKNAIVLNNYPFKKHLTFNSLKKIPIFWRLLLLLSLFVPFSLK